MMELKSICKSFGENEVLRDISMIIPKGGRVLITGPLPGAAKRRFCAS